MSFRVFTSYSKGVYFPGQSNEAHWSLGPPQVYIDYASVPKLVHCHERNNNAAGTSRNHEVATMVIQASKFFATVVPDGGGTLWGNDASEAYMDAVYSYITGGSGEKISLMGVSHGGLTSLVWAKNNPEKVQAIALVQPALSLADLMVVEGGILAADINAAYGGSYNDTNDGPDHSPVKFAEDIDEEIPICLFTSDDGADTVTRSGPVIEFIDARPTTKRVTLGPIQHGLPAVVLSTPLVVDFLIANRP